MLFFMGSGHRKGHFQGHWHRRSELADAVVRGAVNLPSTVRQPSVNQVNLHDAWQWDSGFAFIACMQVSALPHFKTVQVHRLVECLYRQAIPRILWVGAYRLVE